MNAEGTCLVCKIPLTVSPNHEQVKFVASAGETFIQLTEGTQHAIQI